jgi:hypothetical protein
MKNNGRELVRVEISDFTTLKTVRTCPTIFWPEVRRLFFYDAVIFPLVTA